MTDIRKAPRWTVAFLRALERTGSPRAAAVDAGVDHSTVYARRRAHVAFAEAWDAALAAYELAGAEADPSTIFDGPPPRSGEDLLASTSLSGGQERRVGAGKWTPAVERRFFEALAGTANVSRAAQIAGVSTNAIYARRIKHAPFRAKWEAVLETGRAAIEMKLIEAANRSFDPDDLDLGDFELRVSVAEAIRIVQLHGSKADKQSIAAIEPPAEEVEAMRERLFHKLERLRQREMPKWLAEGWTLDESHDHLVPPGWIRAE